MSTFLIALLALILGYLIYGKIVDKMFGPTDAETPAFKFEDGVDYIPMPTWKIFMLARSFFVMLCLGVYSALSLISRT